MDLFDAKGLPYPSRDWTWDEALDMARKLTRDIDGDGRIDQWGLAWPFARGYEGPMMKGWSWTRANGREINIDDPVFYETLQWMADLIHVEHVAPSLEQIEGTGATVDYLLFTTGKIAMQSGGRWQTAIYKRELRTFKITEQSLENMRSGAIPDSVLEKLEKLKNRKLNQQGMSEREELRDFFREATGADEHTIGLILENVEMEDLFRWDTAWLPIPEKGAERRYTINSEAWGIYRGSEVIEEAWKVLKWVSGPKGSAVLGRIGGAVPAVKSVAYSPDFLESHPPSREGNLMWLDAMENVVRPPLEPRWAKIDQMMQQTLELGWNGQRSFKDLCLELKPKLDRLLQEP
jgi:ABC-type glycerol-3-phosphate transport system substrate-binding protein